MSARLAAIAAAALVSLTACTVPVPTPGTTATVTAPAATPAAADEPLDALAILRVVWNDQSATDQASMCEGFRLAPGDVTDLFVASVDGGVFTDAEVARAFITLMAEEC